MTATVPVALIAGGTKGIGRATALELARRGVHVALVGRSRTAGEATLADIRAAGGDGAFLGADLSLMADVRRLAADVLNRYDRLDLLIHSADVLRMRRAETLEGLELSFATNYLSRFLLDTLLLDLLKASAPARVLHIAAAGFPGKLKLAHLPPGPKLSSFAGHNIGQRANDVLGVELGARLAGSGVTINVLNPGLVDTEIRRNSPDGRWLMRLMERVFRASAVTPEQFAQQVVRAATAPETAHWNGQLISAKGVPMAIRPAIRDPATRAGLWHRSALLVGSMAAEAPPGSPIR